MHLVGGGRDAVRGAALFRPFVDETLARVGDKRPTIALLLVLEADDDSSVRRFRGLLTDAGAPPECIRVRAILEGETFESNAIDAVDAIVVGGGLTPAYLDAVEPVAVEIRERVASGIPYLGFSAGAAIAPERALVGGYLRDGVIVSPEDAAEELGELAVRPGLGIVGVTVDVHAAQWGTLSRLVAAVDAGLIEAGAAIDEHTALTGEDVRGAGHVWDVARSAGSIQVSLRKG